MRKSGFHVQATSPQLREAILAVKPTVIVSLAHDRDFWWGVKKELPDVFLIGRRYEEDRDWRQTDPRWWADQCARLEMPYDAFITWNEPTDVYNDITLELAARHDDWCCEFRRHIVPLGYQAVALNVPTGHFHRNAVINLFPNVCQTFRYIGLHEYSARAMWDQDPTKQRPMEKVPKNEGDIIGRWYCQRYRDWHDGIVARWPEREGKFQMIVTECGIAYGVMPGYGDVGWRTDLGADQYLVSLRWYFGEMNRDDYCLGGAIFMVGFADHKWASFETLPLWEWLLDISEVGAVPEPPAPPPVDNGGNGMSIKIYDFDHGPGDAEAVDWDWLVDTFGDVQIRAIEDKEGLTLQEGDVVYKLDYLDARIGDANIVINVRDEDGNPVQGEAVVFGWPDAPAHGLPDKPSNWTETGVIGPTNENGDNGPGLGTGAYYSPDKGERGPHFVWVYGLPSDYVDGLGMLGMTNHAHLNLGYRAVKVGEGETPPEEPTGDKFVEISRAFQEEGNNRILLIAQDMDFYETRASIRIEGTDVDMGPFHPETLTKYNLTVDYDPGEGEEGRVFVVTIERPDGEIISDWLQFPYETGKLGWWTSLVEWQENDGGQQPEPPGPQPGERVYDVDLHITGTLTVKDE